MFPNTYSLNLWVSQSISSWGMDAKDIRQINITIIGIASFLSLSITIIYGPNSTADLSTIVPMGFDGTKMFSNTAIHQSYRLPIIHKLF
jgi:hypothetical protein